VDARRPFHSHVFHARHPKGDDPGRGHVHVHGRQRTGADPRGGTGAGRSVPARSDCGSGTGGGQAARGRGGGRHHHPVQRFRQPGAHIRRVDPGRASRLPTVR